MSTSAPLSPPVVENFNPTLYSWRPYAADVDLSTPGCTAYRRPALGAENLWLIRDFDKRSIFVSGHLEIPRHPSKLGCAYRKDKTPHSIHNGSSPDDDTSSHLDSADFETASAALEEKVEKERVKGDGNTPFELTSSQFLEDIESISTAAKEGWKDLRFAHPEIAVRGVVAHNYVADGGNNERSCGWLEYPIPASEGEIEEWAVRTMAVETAKVEENQSNYQREKEDGRMERIGFTILKGHVENLIEQKNGRENCCNDGNFLFLLIHYPVPSLDSEDSKPVGEDWASGSIFLEIIMRFDHLVTDGIGAKVLVGKFLGLFAERLKSAESDVQHPWPKSVQNISRPWTEIISQESKGWVLDGLQEYRGEEFEGRIKEMRETLGALSSNPGLPLRASNTSLSAFPVPMQRTYSHTLSQDDTSALFSAVRNELKPIQMDATITHLIHGAMAVVLANASPSPPLLPLCPSPPPPLPNPPEAETTTPRPWISPCWLNARRYLPRPMLPSTSLAPPTSAITNAQSEIMRSIPLCQSLVPIRFADLNTYRYAPDVDEVAKADVLRSASLEAGKGYARVKGMGSALPAAAIVMGGLAREMFSSAAASGPAAGGLVRPVADPFLLSDGLAENYIARTYPIPTSSTHDSSPCGDMPPSRRQPVLIVRDVELVANAEGPNLILRLSTFRERLRVSAEWRAEDYEEGVVQTFVDEVVEVAFLLVA